MATFSESAVTVAVALRRTESGDEVFLRAESYATVPGGGTILVRAFGEENVTAIVPPDLLPHVQALLDAAVAYTKARFEIP